MEPKDLKSLLADVPPMEGPPPAWAAELTPDELIVAARWIRTQLDAHEHRAAVAALTDRLVACREREGQGSILRPIFDAALVALELPCSPEDIQRWRLLVDGAESTSSGFAQVHAWITALQTIVGDRAGMPGPPTNTEAPAPPSANAETVETEKPPTLVERCRSLVKDAERHLTRTEDAGGARWGVDFGTAWSKAAVRSADGVVAEHTNTTQSWPSVVAVQRDGDLVHFGQEARDVSRDATGWNVCTSIKRFLVGQRIEIGGMRAEMTTEKIAVLYIAWLIHSNHVAAGDELSPLSLKAHLSLPLAPVGSTQELRQYFAGGPSAPKQRYSDWLVRAFRMAQLIALTYLEKEWPKSVSELLTVLHIWDQKDWEKVQRQVGKISEPAAVVGDFEPHTLPEGLTLLVDCGAGTTDVSVFCRRGEEVYRVVEHSAVVGGDTVDVAIVKAVLDKLPGLSSYRSSISQWARDAKPELLTSGSVEFDPDTVLNVRNELPIRVGVEDVQAGLDRLGNEVDEVVSRAILEAVKVLGEAQPRHKAPWPRVSELKQAWFSGGSSAVAQVPQAINAALKSHGVKVTSSLLKAPTAYSGWNEERYRTMSCAVGASRRELLRPQALPGASISNSANLDWDKDAG